MRGRVFIMGLLCCSRDIKTSANILVSLCDTGKDCSLTVLCSTFSVWYDEWGSGLVPHESKRHFIVSGTVHSDLSYSIILQTLFWILYFYSICLHQWMSRAVYFTSFECNFKSWSTWPCRVHCTEDWTCRIYCLSQKGESKATHFQRPKLPSILPMWVTIWRLA